MSAIINTASKYAANSFLSEDRTNITTTMTANVDAKLKYSYAHVISLQMRNVQLEPSFVASIDNILSEKLNQAKLAKQKDTQIADAIRLRDIELQQYVTLRQDATIEAQKEIDLEYSNREQQLIQVTQDYDKEVERANSDRITSIVTAQGNLNDATITRAGDMQRGKNDAAALEIYMKDQCPEYMM